MTYAAADLRKLATGVLGHLREGGVDGLAPLLHERIVMELPYAPKGTPTRIDGRDAVVTALGFIKTQMKYFRIIPHEVYECLERGTVILEATSVGQWLAPAPMYQNRYVFVFGFDDGLLLSWKEFFNPYAVIWSQGARGNVP